MKGWAAKRNISNTKTMPNYLGQHFLKNPGVAKKIIAGVDIQPGDTIVEVGPGRGALTMALAAVCARTGAALIAIEKDEKLAESLEAELATVGATINIKIIRGDALKILNGLEVKSPFKIVGNIPYYITGHLFRIVGELAIQPARCVFMVQEEVAERIIAKPPKMNRLAASVQFWTVPKIIVRAPKEDFSPPPKVDSAVLLLETQAEQHTAAQTEQYYAMVRMLFAQPRKTILNNLSMHTTNKAEIDRALQGVGITSGLRPQNLTIENIRDIAAALR